MVEKGTLDDVRNFDTETLRVEWNDKWFEFEYKEEIPGPTKTRIAMDASNSHGMVSEFEDGIPVDKVDVSELQIGLLEEYIVDSSVQQLKAFLHNCPEEIWMELVEEILNDDTEEGN